MKVGDTVIINKGKYGYSHYVLLKIDRETPKFWILSNGQKANKQTLKIQASQTSSWDAGCKIEEFKGKTLELYELQLKKTELRKMFDAFTKNKEYFFTSAEKNEIVEVTDLFKRILEITNQGEQK